MSFETAKTAIGSEGTFCLKNLKHYQRLEADDPQKGDAHENKGKFNDGHKELGGATLVSCWTIIKEELNSTDWELFREYREGVAVVSTVNKVETFLARKLENILLSPWEPINREVKYYNEGGSQPSDYDIYEAFFWKRKRYEEQREYRFAIVAGSIRSHLHSVVFIGNSGDYIDEIYFSPYMPPDKKCLMFEVCLDADLTSKINNFDEVAAAMKGC